MYQQVGMYFILVKHVKQRNQSGFCAIMVCFLHSIWKNIVLPMNDEFVGPSHISKNYVMGYPSVGDLAWCAHT